MVFFETHLENIEVLAAKRARKVCTRFRHCKHFGKVASGPPVYATKTFVVEEGCAVQWVMTCKSSPTDLVDRKIYGLWATI